MGALAPRFSDFKSALSPPARPLPKTFRGTGERSFQQKSRGRPRLRCGESTWCVRTPQRRHPLAQVVSPALTTCRAGFVPTLEMREERQTGLRNVPQVAQSQALQPGRVASPVRWRLPLVSDQLQAGTWAPRSEGAGLGPVPPGTCHGWAVPLVPRSRCARGRTQPRVPRRSPPAGRTHQSPSQAYGLGASCGPQPSSLRRLLPMPGPGQRRRRRPTVASSCNKALAPRGRFLTTEPGKNEK